MSDSGNIETTMNVLEKSHSPVAMAALIHGLQVHVPSIRDAAAKAILRTGSSLGKIEIIRNVKSLSPEVVEALDDEESDLSIPLQHCLEHGDEEVGVHALETIGVGKIYREIPLVIKTMRRGKGGLAEQAEVVLATLVDALLEEFPQHSRNASVLHEQIIEDTVQRLWAELNSADPPPRPRILIESLLSLVRGDHPVARMLLRDTSDSIKSHTWDILQNSRHPGVMQYLASAFSMKYLPNQLFETIVTRDDIEFQLAFLRSIPEKPSVCQERNFKNLHGLTWLLPGKELWDTIPEELHANVVRLIQLMGITDFIKVTFAQSVFQHGSVSARESATELRKKLTQGQYESFVVDAVNGGDTNVEVWAIKQLRETTLPDRYRWLVDRLDSPDGTIVDAVRESIGTFDVTRAIEFTETAKPSVGPKIAELYLKVNPMGIQELSRELANPIRTRRLRAARAIQTMRIADQVVPALVELLHDTDSIVRRIATEVISDVPTRQVKAVLRSLYDDKSARVRDAAAKAVEKIEYAISMQSVPTETVESK